MNLVILGMHRSGTSLVAQLLVHMGISAGDESALIGANEENPDGFWERRDVIALNDTILARFGASWCNPNSLPLPKTLTASDAENAEIHRIASELEATCPWFVKDPRLCLTWPLWQQQLSPALPLLVTRHPLAVAHSLRKRNGLPLALGLALWQSYWHYLARHLSSEKIIWLDYDALLADPQTIIASLSQQLTAYGAKYTALSAEQLAALVKPSLRRSHYKDEDIQLLTASQQTIWQALQQQRLPAAQAEMSAPTALLQAAAEVEQLHQRWQLASQDANRHEQTALTQRPYIVELERQTQKDAAHIAELVAELAAIKSTRYWRLREWVKKLIHPGG